MRELFVVALSSDGRHVVLTSKKGSPRGSYLLRVGPRLQRALNGELNDDGSKAAPPPPAESALTPKEIQARLRAGHPPEKVARAAGVPVERITRFYGPVLSERAQVIDAARQAVLVRARKGPSAASLGDSVSANLAAKGVSPGDEERWSAHRREDGSWLVSIAVTARGRERSAEWVWLPASRELKAVDAYALALGSVDSPLSRRRRSSPASR
ncbi:MAG TPA: septation protein SepH [Mycobacteriales bacterium]|nr:septation protein SepH [Mycobacteriales bacterium]